MEKKETRKDFLINQMLEAKRIELENRRKSLFNRLKYIFSKPVTTKKEKINALKKTLQKKEEKELEYMILQKEENILSLKKKIKDAEERKKLNKIIDLLHQMKKKEGKREQIGREIGLKSKEVAELQKELKERGKKLRKKEKRIEKEEEELEEIEDDLGKKPKKKKGKIKIRKITVKSSKTGKIKTARKKRKKTSIKRKKGKQRKKEKISFTSPLKELRKKIEKGVGKKKKKAIESFHHDFTSGKEKTLVSIKGDTQIIAGKHGGKGAQAAPAKMSRTEAVQMQKSKEKETEFEITKVKEKMKNLKAAFFHRKISEEDYKKKLFEYQEELHSLEMEKKRPITETSSKQTPKMTETVNTKADLAAGKKTGVREIKSTGGLKTVQDEMMQTAVKHTPKSKADVQQALRAFHQEFTSEPYFGSGAKPKGIYKIETPEELEEIKPTGIIKRIAPTIKENKAMEMETKLLRLMKENKIDESQIRKEFEFVSPQELMNRFDRILNAIERKYAQKTEIIQDKVIKDKITKTEKKKEKKEIKIKEIKEKKIVTDFDRLLQLVKEKGKINEKDAGKELKLNSGRIRECYIVLEKNDLIKLNFPMFGGTQIISKEYVPQKKGKKKAVK